MKTTRMDIGFGRKIMALAILAAFGPAHADDEVAALTTPDSWVSAGAAVVSGDGTGRSISSQYNGLRDHKGNLLLDLDLVKRDNATGMWTILQGRNLGLDNREFNAAFEKQGDWKVSAGYNEITHHEIRTINTGDTGVGSTSPVVNRLSWPGTGTDVNLDIKRKAVDLGGQKWLTPSLLFEASFKSENKDGARFTGKGYDCATSVCQAGTGTVKNAILMQAEPINYNTKQLEMKLAFVGDKLNANAGYYGSLFTNSNGSVNMTVPSQLNNAVGVAGTLYNGAGNGTGTPAGGTTLQNVLQSPFALPPDNQAHQFYVDGNYAFTKTTKATFKLAYTHATQNEDFASMGLVNGVNAPPAGASSLGGVLNTKLMQFGLTAKPLPKLSLLANVRYEDRDDKTPKYLYNSEGASHWYNGSLSNTKWAGKFEASYLFPENFRGTFGIDYNKLKREVPTNILIDNVAGMSALRQSSNETDVRLELSRMMSDSLTGTIGYMKGKRKGSDWTSLSTTVASSTLNAYCGGVSCYGQTLSDVTILNLSSTSIFPVSMADMDREKWKIGADWSPAERLSLQFLAQSGQDTNASAFKQNVGGKGFRKNENSLLSVDAAYTLSDAWKITGYASHGVQTLNINHSSGYDMELNDSTDTIGLGVVGKPSGRFEIGANLNHIADTNKYKIGLPINAAAGTGTSSWNTLANQANQAAIGLPDVVYKQTVLSLYAKYAIDKQSDLRVDFVHERDRLSEWAWGNNGVPFVYADNTTVTMKENQSVNYIGARYIYKFK